jgi:sterol 3beta-glucosyltransferase
MRISILALGTRGDIQPSLALAQTLAGRGHAVRFISHPGFAGLAGGRGVEFCPLAAMQGELASPIGKDLFAKGLAPFRSFRATAALAKRYSLEWSRQSCALATGSDCVIGTTFTAFTAATLGKQRTIPFIQAFFQPILPTRAFSSIFLPKLPVSAGLVNWLTHQIFNQILWSLLRPLASEAARELWPSERLPLRTPLRSTKIPSRPTLLAFSRHVVPPPADWDASVHVTGYWFLERSPDWQPSAELIRFLTSGPPPVYVGFSSMTLKDPAATVALVLAAAEKAKCRLVLDAGWGGLRPADPPDWVFSVSDIPHDWLFPRMAAIVHHGGAGTVGEILRAGRPSIAIPFVADQPFWGRRLADLGVAASPLPFRSLKADCLAKGIECCLHDLAIQAEAARFQALIAAEEGARKAAELIESAARGDMA